MRNLKKVLTLVLTLAMLLSVMVVGAGAAFSDQTSIKNTEAVNTCNALNIINGENGSFYPTRNVTRAEMCKMICVALNGGREPALATGTTSTFTDTVGHWASPYIEYCVREGVVGGIGGGLFDPNGDVTGTQAAKMLLVAMGYEASRQGYVGSNAWELNINSDAAKKGLYDGLESIDASAALNRDNAAQIIYNALDAAMVEYVYSAQTVGGTLTMVPALKDRTLIKNGTEVKCTILSEIYEVDTNYGQLVDIDGGSLTIRYDPNYASQATGTRVAFTKVGVDYSEYLGQTVKILYKSSDNVLGVAPVDGNTVYTVAASSLETAGTNNEKIKFNDTEYKLEEMTVSGTPLTASNTANQIATLTVGDSDVASDSGVTASALATGAATSYDTVTFVDNDNDGTLEYAVITKVETGKVTYTNSDEIIVAGVDTFNRNDNQIASDVAKDEYVTVTYDPFADNDVVSVIPKATGTLSVNDAQDEYLLDGTWYKKGTLTLNKTNAGTNYDFWAYNGVMVAADQAGNNDSIDNLVMVLNKSSATMKNQVLIMFADGTQDTVNVVANDYADDDVNFDESALGAGDGLNVGTLYLATETSKGWTFDSIANNREIGDYTFTNTGNLVDESSKIAAVGANNIPISDDAVVFVYGGSGLHDGKILTGKQLKSMNHNTAYDTGAYKIQTASKGFFTSKVNGLTRASIVAVALDDAATKMPNGNVLGDNYGLILGALRQVDSKHIAYTVWDGTKPVTVTEEKSSTADRAQFTVITYGEINAENVISDVDHVVVASADTDTSKLITAAVYSTQDGKLWYGNGSSDNKKLTSDTVYMVYDSSKTKVEDIGKTSNGVSDLVRANEAVEGSNVLLPNVKFIHDGTDVEFVLIDVNNVIKDEAVTVTSSGTVSGSITSALNPTTGVKYGDALTVTVTIPNSSTLQDGTIALTGAVEADSGNAYITIPADIANSSGSDITRTYTIVVTGDSVSVGALTPNVP